MSIKLTGHRETHDPLARAAILVVAAGLLTSCAGSEPAKDTDGAAAEQPSVPLLATDFKQVCSGTGQSRAADYATATTHKLVYLETYQDGLLDDSSSMPAEWVVTFDPESDALAAVDTVACAVRSSEKLAATCPGYEDDDGGTSGTVKWHTATYQVTAYAAKTGARIDSVTIEADDTDCPSFATFDDGQAEVDMYAMPNDEKLVSFLRPIMQP